MAKRPTAKHSSKHPAKAKPHVSAKKPTTKKPARHHAASKAHDLQAEKPLELTEHPEHYVSPDLPGQSFSPQPVDQREPTSLAPSKVTKLLEAETESGHLDHVQLDHEFRLDQHLQQVSAPSPIDPTARPDHTERSPDQQAALLEVQTRTADSNRYVYQRAKSLLAAAILLSLVSLYALIRSLFAEDLATIFFAVPISLISLGMSAYLFYARDHNIVSFVLKIFIVVQFISTLASLYSITDGKIDLSALNGVLLVFLVYVHGRVKSLSYY